MKKIEAVFFDAGNTLLCPYPSVGATMAEVVNSYGYEKSADDFDAHMPEFFQYYAQVYENDDSFWSEHDRQQQMWIDGYSLVLRRACVEEDQIEDIVNDIYNAFDEPRAWRLFNGVEKTMAELKAQGLKIGIISNWGRGLDSILYGHGLAPYIDAVIASAEVRLHKPNKEIFEYALRELDVAPDHAMHVGDHIVADVAGCSHVGMTPVLIAHENKTMFDPTTKSCLEGVECISQIDQVLKVVKRLNAESL